MAYQNVGTPRFYIDYFSYWQSIGLVYALKSYIWNGNHHEGHFIGLDPSSNTTFSQDSNIAGAAALQDSLAVSVDLKEAIPNRVLDSINFGGFLGHNLNTYSDDINECLTMFKGLKRDAMDSSIGNHTNLVRIQPHNITNSDIVNAENHNGNGNWVKSYDSGFTLSKLDIDTDAAYNDEIDEVDRFIFKTQWQDADESNVVIEHGKSWNCNCLVLGHYYDMPHSPDLDVKMDIEFDGYDTTETLGGSTLTNIRYEGAPKWGTKNAWEIGESNPYYKRRGRRIWSLKFSYLNDKDLFPSNYSSNTWLSNTTDNSGYAADDLDVLNYSEMAILNKGFDDWTGTDPDNWRIFARENAVFAQTSTTKIEESSTGILRFLQNSAEVTEDSDVYDNTGALVIQPYLSSGYTFLVIGQKYKYTIDIDTVTSGACVVKNGSYSQSFNSTGVKTGEFTATSTQMRITADATVDTDYKLESFKLYKSNPSDFTYTLADDDSFVAKVLNFVGNGQRFIFQPDNTNNNPDQFAICVLDQDSLSIGQKAFKAYNISLKIKEVW